MLLRLLVVAMLLQAQGPGTTTGAIHGVVREAGSQAPIARAVVFVSGGGVATDTRTDADGRFVFPALPPGTYDLLAAKPGFTFDQRKTPHVTVSAGEAATVTMEMTRGR